MKITATVFMIISIAVLFYLATPNLDTIEDECNGKFKFMIHALVFGTLITLFFEPFYLKLNNL